MVEDERCDVVSFQLLREYWSIGVPKLQYVDCGEIKIVPLPTAQRAQLLAKAPLVYFQGLLLGANIPSFPMPLDGVFEPPNERADP